MDYLDYHHSYETIESRGWQSNYKSSQRNRQHGTPEHHGTPQKPGTPPRKPGNTSEKTRNTSECVYEILRIPPRIEVRNRPPIKRQKPRKVIPILQSHNLENFAIFISHNYDIPHLMLHAIQQTHSVFYPYRTSWIRDGCKITVRKTNHNAVLQK